MAEMEDGPENRPGDRPEDRPEDRPGDLPARDPAAIRAALARERAELLAASENSAAERRPVALDQQSVGRLSRMDAMQVQAMAQAVEVRRKGRLSRIEAALKRLDDGDYGFCLACGEEIPMKRLAVDLTLTHCVDCAG